MHVHSFGRLQEREVAPEIAQYWERAEFPHHMVPKLAKLNLGVPCHLLHFPAFSTSLHYPETGLHASDATC